MYPQHCFLAIGVCAVARKDTTCLHGKICQGSLVAFAIPFFKAEYIILVSICSSLISPPLDAVRCRQWHGGIYLLNSSNICTNMYSYF